jgi:hypothetical protein
MLTPATDETAADLPPLVTSAKLADLYRAGEGHALVYAGGGYHLVRLPEAPDPAADRLVAVTFADAAALAEDRELPPGRAEAIALAVSGRT